MRGVLDNLLSRAERQDSVIARLVTDGEQQQATIERQSKSIDSLEATVSQQQVVIQQLRRKIDLQHVDNLATKRDLGSLQSSLGRQRAPVVSNVGDQRRALSTACERPTGARLLVEGLCSCQDDVLIGGRSVGEQLENLIVSVAGLNSSVGELNASVGVLSSLSASVYHLNTTVQMLLNASEAGGSGVQIETTTYKISGTTVLSITIGEHDFCAVSFKAIYPSTNAYSCSLSGTTLTQSIAQHAQCTAYCFDVVAV